ncbi:hypothetical protein GA069_26535 [Vibrio parahaemolyticus]|nr:hypothetical protein [Vibrio parahaemolyticus]EGQ9133344.1 hypothetical protein [Vibrio parahaemolyticus]HDM8225465.1 hypothetical protein [Vibrio campbellii]
MKNENNGFIIFGRHFYKNGFKHALKKNLMVSFLVGFLIVLWIFLSDPKKFVETIDTAAPVAQEPVSSIPQEQVEKDKERLQSKNYGNQVKPLNFDDVFKKDKEGE